MRALLNSFTAGLLDGTLVGRVDLPNLNRGALRLENFLPRVTGGLFRRPGTLYRGTLTGECRLIPFNFSREQRFQLEAGNGYLAIWKDGVKMPTVYAAPWSAANVHRWHFVQINDVMFFTDQENEAVVLTRRGDNDWLLERWNDRLVTEPNGWPAMLDENVTATTLAAAATTGSGVALTASADVFVAADVGSFYELAHRLDVPAVEISLSDGSGTASAVLTLTALPTAGEQFSVGSGADLRVYTWVADTATPGAYQVRIGSSGAEGAAANAVKALNGTVDAAVGPGTIAHPLVTARSGGIFAAGVKATGRLTFTDNDLTNGTPDEFTIGSITYSFADSVASGAAYRVKRGATLADSIDNAIKAITATGSAGTHYTAGTLVHPDVTAALSVVANAIDVTAQSGGTAGNAIATTVDHTSRMSWGAATLTGGEDGNSAKVLIESRVPGSNGNGIATADTMAAGSWNAAATSGGVTVSPVSAELRVNGNYEVVTFGTWWGTLLLKAETSPGVWETIRAWTSKDDTNISATGLLSGEQAMRLEFDGAGTDARAELRMTDSLIRGLVRIVSVTDARNAVCDVVRDVYSTSETVRWSEAAWSDRRGWPRTVAVFEQSIVMGGTAHEPQKVRSSGKGDFFNFRRDGLSDSAWEYQLAGHESSPVAWLAPTSFGLVVGTEKEEWLLSGGDAPITPTNPPTSRRHTAYGAAGIQITTAGPAMLFVQDGARGLLEYVWDDAIRGFVAPDLTELVEGAMVAGIRQMAWQRSPFAAVWVVMEDGRFLSMTYRREREVVAWAEHPMPGGTVESVCVTNGSNGHDEVWLAVRRTVNGATVRYLEQLDTATHLALFSGNRDALTYLDCAMRATSATPSVEFSGFDHLEGELVSVTADNAAHPQCRVTGGIIRLQSAASLVLAGIAYESAVTPMPIDAQMQDGTAQGRKFRVAHMSVNFWKSAAAMCAVPGQASFPVEFRESISADPVDLFTGVKPIHLGGSYGDSVEFTISTSDAEPLNILWVTPAFSVHGP